MKTPREILLARHRAVEPKLDVARQRAVEQIAESSPFKNAGNSFLASVREFFRIPRMAWGGLAAAWVVILVLNHASSETPSQTAATQEAKRSPEILLALREQKRFFAELVGVASEKLDAEAPRFIPRPRSESLPQTACV